MAKRKRSSYPAKGFLIGLLNAFIVVGIISIFGVAGGVDCETISIEMAVMQLIFSFILISAGTGGKYAIKQKIY